MVNDNSKIINQKAIIWFNCCTNGKNRGNRKNIPEHMFIILTKKSYNDRSCSVCGIPITSEKDKYQHHTLNYGVNITNDDIDGENFSFTKESFILCDRPTRLDKKDLSVNQKHICRVKKEKFENIVSQLQAFLKRGRILCQK